MSQEPEEQQRDRSNRWPELLFAAGLVLIILVLMVLVSIWIPKPVPQVNPAVVKAVRPVLDLPREQLLLEAGRVLKVAPMASDDERQRHIAFVEAIRKLTAEQEEPDAFLLQTVTELFVSLPRSIRSALGDLAVSNSAATLREELFDTSAEGPAARAGRWRGVWTGFRDVDDAGTHRHFCCVSGPGGSGSAASDRDHAGSGRSMGADPGEAGTITGSSEILIQTSPSVNFGQSDMDQGRF